MWEHKHKILALALAGAAVGILFLIWKMARESSEGAKEHER